MARSVHEIDARDARVPDVRQREAGKSDDRSDPIGLLWCAGHRY